MELSLDEIGSWTEKKLQIIEAYAKQYSKILAANNLHYVYIDGFAGAGKHRAKGTGKIIAGSPQRVLSIAPPFKEYHFVEIVNAKVTELEKAIVNRPEAKVYERDCNEILPSEIFPKIKFSNFYRGFCLLDPYGLDLNWSVIQKAGEMKTIDLLLNFPIMDINRNVLRDNSKQVSPEDVKRMNCYWGDDSWKAVVFDPNQNLFGLPMKLPYAGVVLRNKFHERLRTVAGFKYVARPLPMRNSKRAIVYYLFFASQYEAAVKIMQYIFNKHH